MRALPLVVLICALAFMTAPALAEDMTFTINKDFKSGGLAVHVNKVTITDKAQAGTYSTDPDNTIWPKVWFTYENNGTEAALGRSYVLFVDDKGNKYGDRRNNEPIFDATMDPISPGKTSTIRFVEVAAPKGTKIAQVILYDEGMHEALIVDLPGGGAATSTNGEMPTPAREPCTIGLVLPILAVGLLMASRIKH